MTFLNPAHEYPTVELVRYVADTLRSTKPASPERDATLTAAETWLAGAEERFEAARHGEDVEEAIAGAIEEAGAVIVPMDRLIELKRTTHSLIVNWNDRDAEEGTYGATVQAWSVEHAEALVRSAMEGAEPFHSDFDGTVVDHSQGPAWKAADLETALADLLEWETQQGGCDAPCWQAARKLMGDIRAGR